MSATPRPERRVPSAHQGKLERPVRIRLGLQRALAEGELTMAALAKKYDVTAASIREFRVRHADAIEHIRANLDDEYAGMWIADKRERLQRYQNTAEILEQQIEAADQGQTAVLADVEPDEDGEATLAADISGPLSRLTRALNNTLKAAAEERGQLPTRMVLKVDEGSVFRHELVGIDVDKLR